MFTHLHNHSQYSLLDGQSRLDRMVHRAADLGQRAIALTDHGNLYGAIEFYLAAREAGVKPIIGVEAYVAPGSRRERNPNNRFPFHLTLLARSEAGYRNLIQLVSIAHLEGFYYRPRVDRETLERYAEGIIVLSGCPSGEVPRLIAQGRLDEARETAQWYRDVFGDGYYFELMSHEGVKALPAINRGLVDLARETEIPLVATNDTHYTYREDHPLHDILLCIQTNSTVNERNRLRFDSESFYVKSEAEMSALWPELPEAIANTQRIADSCELEIEFGHSRLPRFKTPNGEPAIEFLTKLSEEGLRARFPEVTPEIESRLRYELDVIDRTGFADYQLVAWDIGRFAHEQKILMGVRGSAAASLVLYCLGVTEIDPIETRLVFERYLNLERREMPDIDFDFQDDRRGEVIRWAAERYGAGHVAQIITFGTLGAKAAVRDVGRALGIDYGEVDHVARLIPARLGMTLDRALEESAELAQLADSTPQYRRLLDSARALEGTVRHASTHAAAVVISDDPLTDVVPLQRPTSGDETAVPTTQFSMDPVARLGLLKVDFLGLTNLTVLDRALKLINLRRGSELSLRDIPLDDRPTFDLLDAGDTFGVFQLESDGMRRYVKELKPTSVADISAMIALYRPGPMEHIPTFIDAKHGRKKITYPHADLKEILRETYGVIVYQDQVLLIAQAFGGYTLGEADILRKAMGKKDPEVMAAEREKFISGALSRGYSRELAVTMFELIEPFAGYAFNKAHSAFYAMIAYWTAYLKANYKLEYLVAVLDAASDNPDRLAAAVREARRLGIPTLGPSVNSGAVGFSISETDDARDAIRFGLAAVKNVGAAAVQPIIDAREKDGPFKSVEDFARRVEWKGLNKRMLESLIKVGALDSLAPRGPLLESCDRILALIQRETRRRESGQATMFDLLGDEVPAPAPDLQLGRDDDISERERIRWERELLGAEITETAFTREMQANGDRFVVFASQVTADRAGARIGLLGQVHAVRRLTTRSGDTFLAVSVGLLDGEIEVIVWPDRLEQTKELWAEGRFVTVMGTIRERDGRISVAADEAREYRLPDGAGESKDPADAAQHGGAPAGVALPVPPAANDTPPAATAVRDPVTSVYYNGVNGSNGADSSATGSGSNGARPEGGMVVRVAETGEALEDRYRLEDVVKTLLEFRGSEAVTLEVETDGRIVRMDMPFVTVHPCPELTGRLTEMLGAGNVRSAS